MCPICVTSPTHRSRSRFVLLAEHIATAHDDESGGAGDDLIPSSSVTPVRRERNEEVIGVSREIFLVKNCNCSQEDSDEDEDEDEEALSNDLEHRAFVEEEHRRQETTRQRLAHNASLAAVIRNDYAAALSGNASSSQRRPFVRQTAVRGARGSLRGKFSLVEIEKITERKAHLGHFTNYPYGTAPRLATGFASSAALRAASDASSGNAAQNSSLIDPYAAFAMSQDPMLGLLSRMIHLNDHFSTLFIHSRICFPIGH